MVYGNDDDAVGHNVLRCRANISVRDKFTETGQTVTCHMRTAVCTNYY